MRALSSGGSSPVSGINEADSSSSSRTFLGSVRIKTDSPRVCFDSSDGQTRQVSLQKNVTLLVRHHDPVMFGGDGVGLVRPAQPDQQRTSLVQRNGSVPPGEDLIFARQRGCFVYESLKLRERPALHGSSERNLPGCAVCENIKGGVVEKAGPSQRDALASAWVLEWRIVSCQSHGLLRLRAIADAGCERPRAPQRLVRPTRRRRRKDCSQRPSSPLGRNADGPPQMKWRQAGKFMERLGNSASADWLIALRADGSLRDLPCPESPRTSNMAMR